MTVPLDYVLGKDAVTVRCVIPEARCFVAEMRRMTLAVVHLMKLKLLQVATPLAAPRKEIRKLIRPCEFSPWQTSERLAATQS